MNGSSINNDLPAVPPELLPYCNVAAVVVFTTTAMIIYCSSLYYHYYYNFLFFPSSFNTTTTTTTNTKTVVIPYAPNAIPILGHALWHKRDPVGYLHTYNIVLKP
jgi:hypothetical protein